MGKTKYILLSLVLAVGLFVAWHLPPMLCDVFYGEKSATILQSLQLSGDYGPRDELLDVEITPALPIALAYLALTHPTPEHIVLASPGGSMRAAQLSAWVINQFLPTKVVVAANSLCASACVTVFAQVKNHDIDPKGYLLFHAAAVGAKWKDCVACNWVKMHWPFFALGPAEIRQMGEVAREISPALEAFLDSCQPNPLTTYQGIAISGEQLAQILAGHAPSCASIRHQDSQWLMQKLELRVEAL